MIAYLVRPIISRIRLALNLIGRPSIETHSCSTTFSDILANTEGLAHSHSLERREILDVGVHQVGEFVQAGSALRTGELLPWPFERSSGGFDCCVDVGFACGLDLVAD